MPEEKATVKKTIKKPVVHRERKPRTEKVEKPVKSEKIETMKVQPIKVEIIEEAKIPEMKTGRYLEAIGRRKTAIARVRISAPNGAGYVINKKSLQDYFPDPEMQSIVCSAFDKTGLAGKFSVSALLKGGGLHAQAEAVRHGISRALIDFSPELKKRLKKTGFLTRDPRMRERKKFGLKRARKSPQWAKR
jgi:small subunit ribosomal protein S9